MNDLALIALGFFFGVVLSRIQKWRRHEKERLFIERKRFMEVTKK